MILTLIERVYEQPRSTVLVAASSALMLVTCIDWLSRPYLDGGLGVLYFFPYVVLCLAGIRKAKILFLAILLTAISAAFYLYLHPQTAIVKLGGSVAVSLAAFLSAGFVARKMAFDNSQLHRLADDIRERDRRYALLIGTSAAGVITIDSQHFVTEANDAVERMLGYPKGYLIGRKVGEFFPALENVPADPAIKLSTTMASKCLKKDGTDGTVSIVFSTFEVDGPVIAAIILGTDEDTGEVPEPAVSDSGQSLSPREAKVLRLICSGLQNKAIADDLGMSDHAVKATVQRVYNKLGIEERTRPSLVRAVMEKYKHILTSVASS